LALTLPMLSVSAMMSPASVLTMAGAILGGVLVVRLGASVAARLVPGILAHPDRVL
jgi:hypothetical protein